MPKIDNLPPNIEITVSDGGSMNADVIRKWITSCFSVHGNYFASTKSLLLWDSYGTHTRSDTVELLKQKCNTVAVVIPPRTTSYLQPLDVSVNFPFKNALRSAWLEWLQNGPKDVTAKVTLFLDFT